MRAQRASSDRTSASTSVRQRASGSLIVGTHGQDTGTATASAHGQEFHWIFRVSGSTGIASLVRRTTPFSERPTRRPKNVSASVPVDQVTITTESAPKCRQRAGCCRRSRRSPGGPNTAGSMRSATRSPGTPGLRAIVSSRTTAVGSAGPSLDARDQEPSVRR